MSDTLTIKVDGEDRDIFMSFGLLSELSIIVADPGRVAAIAVDPELRTRILSACLATRKKSGKIEKAVEDIDDVDISISDVEALLGWVMENVFDFFVRALQKSVEVSKRHEAEVGSLASSLGGSTLSASATA